MGEIDLGIAISSAALDDRQTFQRMKDTVKEIMHTYKTNKIQYAVFLFGRVAITPLNFGQTLPDKEAVR